MCTTVTVGLDFEWAEWEGGASVTAAAYVTPCSSAAAVAADFKLRTFCQNVLPITVVGLVTEAGIRSKKVVSFH